MTEHTSTDLALVDLPIDLPQVRSTAPAAVLLVDLAARSVVYANALAEQLAPGIVLPVPVDVWSDTAQLRDVDGAELSDTSHPLSQVARSEPVSGQAVSAARDSGMGRRREPLWVLGLPISGPPQLDGHALVIFLRLQDRDAEVAAATASAHAEVDLRGRAVLATGMAFTVADAQADDLPLLWVNPAFTSTTGYTLEEVVGRNCRFLQGPDTDQAAREVLRTGLAAGEEVSVTLLNYRKDGTAFWNLLSLSPIHGPGGELTHFVGIQTDVTARVLADEERDRALAAERAARLDAEQAREQITLLAEATERLSATLDVDQALERLATLVVPTLADWVLLVTSDRPRLVTSVRAHHRDGREDFLEKYAALVHQHCAHATLFSGLLSGTGPHRFTDYTGPRQRRERLTWGPEHVLAMTEELGAQSAVFVPLPGRHRIIGAIGLFRGADRPAYTEQDLQVAVDLGRRAGLALDNARLYQEEHRIAEALQRSLLPGLPQVPGIRAAAAYRPSERGAEVGGDFYEMIPLPHGALGLAVGDVVGHDVLAAAAMGHLRGLLRACAWDSSYRVLDRNERRRSSLSPGHVLDRVDRLLDGLGISTLATASYATLVPPAGGTAGPAAVSRGWTLAYSTAGHPPLMLRRPDGVVEVLDDVEGLMLGVHTPQRPTGSRVLDPGSTLLAYTDGLVERRGETLDVGLERLAGALRDGPEDLELLSDHLLAVTGESEDDVALLLVGILDGAPEGAGTLDKGA